jgi:hypothetical protein
MNNSRTQPRVFTHTRTHTHSHVRKVNSCRTPPHMPVHRVNNCRMQPHTLMQGVNSCRIPPHMLVHRVNNCRMQPHTLMHGVTAAERSFMCSCSESWMGIGGSREGTGRGEEKKVLQTRLNLIAFLLPIAARPFPCTNSIVSWFVWTLYISQSW